MSDPRHLRRAETDITAAWCSPLRHGSTASTNSSVYSIYSSSFGPSRTSTISSNSSSVYSPNAALGKPWRGAREPAEYALPDQKSSPGDIYGSVRRSLRPLPQVPNASPTPTNKQHPLRHMRSQTVDGIIPDQIQMVENLQMEGSHGDSDVKGTKSLGENVSRIRRTNSRSGHSRNLSTPHTASPPALTSALTAPELQTFHKSSTGHLRTLSKFADTVTKDFAIATSAPSVAGLHGRRQLKRADSVRGAKVNPQVKRQNTSSWTEINWMEKQRQFLQAYEYLCHIGEAKEWIEDVIHKPIPPIVQLEEALRDGVTLAETVQALYPHRTFRIFSHPKLQFRHSDNIALFFQFLDELELPEVFRFELIDLYEKKNIPKVIYCIHALSWLLFKKGVVDFKIGNLVGQLEFEHHELEQTQRGLDNAGVTMPSFSGMGASFGADVEYQPVETEEERISRELHSYEEGICDLQAQARAAIVRLRLSRMVSDLWDNESHLVDLQSRIRGDFLRQIASYRLTMRRFAVGLQSRVRGFLVRRKRETSERLWASSEAGVLNLQSLIRSHRVQSNARLLQTRVRKEESGIKKFQAAIRGAIARKLAYQQCEETRNAAVEVEFIQSAIRGMLSRHRLNFEILALKRENEVIVTLQSIARGSLVRQCQRSQKSALSNLEDTWITVQSLCRGSSVRNSAQRSRSQLRNESQSVVQLQSSVRVFLVLSSLDRTKAALRNSESRILNFQSNVRGFLLRGLLSKDRKNLLAELGQIGRIQAIVRGVLERNSLGRFFAQLKESSPEIIMLQALSRAMLLRLDVGALLSDLENHEMTISALQAFMRAFVLRRKFAEKLRFYRENMEKVVKIQSFVRGKMQGQAYKSLTCGKNPPVSTIKGFVHLLNDSDFDFDEEIEFEQRRKTVVQLVRQNEIADQYIAQLDIKIALLVKNKITLDEVVRHQKHFGGNVGTLLPNADISSKDPFDLKALNKTSRKKLEHYQELFFLLQTQPQYLARLCRRLREKVVPEKECERLKHLMMGLFGYAQKRREEYYLLRLMIRSIKEELDASNSLQDFVRYNPFWQRIFAAYIKSPRDRKFMRDTVGQLIKENVIDNPELDLESDPIQIYRSSINNEELRTGQRSRRPPDLPREEAIRDPETRETFIRHLQDLRDISDQFFGSLEEMLPRMPFGVRFVAQQMYELLQSRFGNEDRGYILQITGQWVWRNYFYPALTEPEKFCIVDRGLTQEQKRNLGEIAKVVQQIAFGRLFGTDNVYLQPLNSYVGESIQRLGNIWANVIKIQDAESYFDIDEFNDLYAKTKPTLYVKMSDIFSIHQLIAAEISNVCLVPDDSLKEVVRDLGNVKSNESELMSVSTSEISLTLTPKLHNVEDPDAEIKTLLMETKRCVLYIIRVQSGANLMEIMVRTPTDEDEERWRTLVRDELSSSSRKRGAYSDVNSMLNIGAMSYPDLKRTALENILHLENVGRVSRRNHYQDLLNEIAVDIRTKHRRRIQRQRELEGVRLTLARLNDQAVYLEQQLKTYNDYIEQAMVTLQNKKGKKRFLMPFTKQWDHERELQRSGRVFKFGSYKYSARNLSDKGVLVYWKGYTERQWDKVDLTISSNEVGVFMIDGSSGNMMIPGANAQLPLDDLLQAQFNNTQFMDFFEGQLRVNVNLFLHLIMRKFYNE